MRNCAWGLTALAVGLVLTVAAPAEAARPKKEERKDIPKATGLVKSRQASADDEPTIRASIRNQKMILELQDESSADYTKQVIALADFYWDLSEVYGRRAQTEKLEAALFAAEEAGDEATASKLRNERNGYVAKQNEYQDQTIKVYKDVIARFPRSANIDELRYYLGYQLGAMKRNDEAVAAFTELILKHPDSQYVPDALVNIGEYYFEDNKFADALKLYQKVEEYPESNVLAYAIYKQSWCHYNLGDYDLSLSKMLAVIKMTREQNAAGRPGALDLLVEARNELIYPYSKAGKATAALTFFKKYAPEIYLDLGSRLAALYTEQTEYDKSNKVLEALIKEARTERPGGKDMSFMVLRFQRQIVDNAFRQTDKAATVAEVKELIRYFEELSASAPEDFRKKEEREVDTLILTIATGYHTEYKTTKAQQTLEYTQTLYDEYLRLFRDRPNAYAIAYNNALLMLMTGKTREAAAEFEKVIAADPGGQYADDSAERAVVAYLETIKADPSVKASGTKSEEVDDLKRRELTGDERQFVQAVDRWLAIIARKGVNKETAENIPRAKFLGAKILYDANQFDEAAPRFADFVDNYPGHEFWEDSARHVLSSYNLAHDIDKLQEYADVYGRNPKLMETDLKADIVRIRGEFNFQKCFKFEQKEEFLAAANCFVTYANENTGGERAPAAIFNAGLNFFKSKQVEKALQMQNKLYTEYQSDKLAPKALYSIGEIFRETTVYEEASKVYETFVTSYPDHALAEKALRYASIFRKTLGQYEEAVRDLETYLKRYPDPEMAPRVHLDVILIRETQGLPTRVLGEVNRHLKSFPGEDAGTRLRVLNARGRAHKALGKPRDADKAFRDTVDYFKSLPADAVTALKMEAVSAVAEAHFNLGEQVLAAATSIKLTGTEKAVQAAIQKKLELMNDAKTVYEQVIAYGHPGWTIAAYTQLGVAYRDLADTVENSEPPSRIRAGTEAYDEYKIIMAEKSAPIRDKALQSYDTALKTARELHWFNEYSERAEQAIAQLDLADVSIKEARLRPDHTGPNSGLPDFKREVR
jgi:TolA-binding protein